MDVSSTIRCRSRRPIALLAKIRSHELVIWLGCPHGGWTGVHPLDRSGSNRRNSLGERNGSESGGLAQCRANDVAGVSNFGDCPHRSHRRGTGLSWLSPSPLDFSRLRVGQSSTLVVLSRCCLLGRFWPSTRRSLVRRNDCGNTLCRCAEVAWKNRRCSSGTRGHERVDLRVRSLRRPLVLVVSEALVASAPAISNLCNSTALLRSLAGYFPNGPIRKLSGFPITAAKR